MNSWVPNLLCTDPLVLTRPLQSGLHADSCEIDQKLHALIAGRKRSMLQSIMEETATNIYLPSPLQGLIGPDFGQPNNTSPGTPNKLNPNVIWITGEFFGVQRLFRVRANRRSQLLRARSKEGQSCTDSV